MGVTWKKLSFFFDHTSLELWRISSVSNSELFKEETAFYRRCALTSQSTENSFFPHNLVSYATYPGRHSSQNSSLPFPQAAVALHAVGLAGAH